MGLFVDRHETLERARADFSWEEAWDLVDGTPDAVNAYDECVGRHEGLAAQIIDDQGTIYRYSFADVQREAGRFASLLEEYGIGIGDRVGIVLEPSISFLAAFFGTLKRGAIAIPAPAYFGPDAVGHRLVDHPVTLLVAPETVVDGLDVDRYESWLSPEEADTERAAQSPDIPTARTAGADRSWIQFTSGTTGRPTAVPFHHESPVYWAPLVDFQVNVQPTDRFFTTASPGWGPGVWAGLFGALIFGRPAGYQAGPFDPTVVIDAITACDITGLVGAAPTALRKLVNETTPETAPELRAITYTGEPMDPGLSREVTATFGAFPRGFYGITELRGNITADYCFPDYDERHGSLGQPVIGTEVAILDEEGEELPTGEIGYIAARRSGDWFISDDLGYVDEDGYFWSDGRADDVIISAGYTIGPSVVEDALRKHPNVAEAGVIGIPDDERGHVVKAFVEPAGEPPPDLESSLQDFVRTELSPHEYPREIEMIDEIPTSGWGKIRRNALRNREGIE
ncbi:MAG: acyl-CoA synthetase [Salinirussus sp.]